MRTFEQLAQVGQLFALLVLLLTDPLQSLRQILDVGAEMLDGFQPVLEVTVRNKQTKENHNQSNESVTLATAFVAMPSVPHTGWKLFVFFLLVLGMVVLEEMLQQLHTFLCLDFVDFQQILEKEKKILRKIRFVSSESELREGPNVPFFFLEHFLFS